jgi:hypothetical protein
VHAEATLDGDALCDFDDDACAALLAVAARAAHPSDLRREPPADPG